MDDGSSYCGCGSKIECVGCGEDHEYGNDRRWRGMKSFCRKTVRMESNMKPRFLADRLGIMGWVEGRERGLTILEVC